MKLPYIKDINVEDLINHGLMVCGMNLETTLKYKETDINIGHYKKYLIASLKEGYMSGLNSSNEVPRRFLIHNPIDMLLFVRKASSDRELLKTLLTHVRSVSIDTEDRSLREFTQLFRDIDYRIESLISEVIFINNYREFANTQIESTKGVGTMVGTMTNQTQDLEKLLLQLQEDVLAFDNDWTKVVKNNYVDDIRKKLYTSVLVTHKH